MIRGTILLILSFALAACSGAFSDNAPREFSGVWLYEFEGSTFLEGVSEVPKQRPSYDQAAWLDYHPDQRRSGEPVASSDKDRYDEMRGCYLTHPYVVRFQGRKITSRRGSGHAGLWASEVKVDRMISAKPLGEPFCYGS